jgi:hypothetical protein
LYAGPNQFGAITFSGNGLLYELKVFTNHNCRDVLIVERKYNMGVKCPTCSADNRPNAKFCFVCGADLTAIIPLTPPVQPISTDNTDEYTPQTGFAPAPKASLVMADGTSLDLEQRTVIGRDASLCNLSFPSDTQLSRKHAVIEEVNGLWRIEDLGSSNGTYVNAQRLQNSVELNSGDKIGMGSTVYVFTFGGQVIATPPALIQTPNLVAAQQVLPISPIQKIGPTPVSQPPPAVGEIGTIHQPLKVMFALYLLSIT